MNFLYYANDSHLFMNRGPEVTTSLYFVFMLTLGIYTCAEVCRIKLDVNLNGNRWILGVPERSNSFLFERKRSDFCWCCTECYSAKLNLTRAKQKLYISSFAQLNLFVSQSNISRFPGC